MAFATTSTALPRSTPLMILAMGISLSARTRPIHNQAASQVHAPTMEGNSDPSIPINQPYTILWTKRKALWSNLQGAFLFVQRPFTVKHYWDVSTDCYRTDPQLQRQLPAEQ
jgi:hypothetical protein